jgi:AcrR family transcriptional regulator
VAERKAGKKPRGIEPVSVQGTATLKQILQASMELFSERGFAAATMRQLADRAGMPISAFYYYYRSKYDVLLAIMETFLDEAELRVREAYVADDPADVQLVSIVSAHVRHHIRNPLAARIADRELRSLESEDLQRMLRRRRAYEQPFRDALKKGIGSGAFPADLDVPIAKNLIITMSTGVIDWWRPRGAHSEADVAGLVGRYALRIAMGTTESG